MKTKREEIFDAIDDERIYQDNKWNSSTTLSEGKHEMESFLFYLDYYRDSLKPILSTRSQADGYEEALPILRKMAALLVACMEQHGVKARE